MSRISFSRRQRLRVKYSTVAISDRSVCNHPYDRFKVLKAFTSATCYYSRDVTWAHPRASLVMPPQPARGGVDFVRCYADATGTAGYVVYANVCRATVCYSAPYHADAATSTACWVSATTAATSTAYWVSAVTAVAAAAAAACRVFACHAVAWSVANTTTCCPGAWELRGVTDAGAHERR